MQVIGDATQFNNVFTAYFHAVSITYKDGNILVSKFNIGFVYFFL
jgi:hypothetical protein